MIEVTLIYTALCHRQAEIIKKKLKTKPRKISEVTEAEMAE